MDPLGLLFPLFDPFMFMLHFSLIAAEVDFQPGQRDHDASGLLYLPVQRQ